jgi:hypothetical protein
MYPKEFRQTHHSLLQRQLVLADFSGHHQTRTPEPMKETIQSINLGERDLFFYAGVQNFVKMRTIRGNNVK